VGGTSDRGKMKGEGNCGEINMLKHIICMYENRIIKPTETCENGEVEKGGLRKSNKGSE
jgi:hypothetical protein